LTIGFLAGRRAPVRIENPRQVSAYDYPRQYGPCSPVFSRASLVRHGRAETLFVSGTSSIVGHVTMHPSDVSAQTAETIANIRAVIEEANRLVNAERFDLRRLDYKVYVRNPEDLDVISRELARCIGGTPKAIYLQADICRQELLLEIEATATHWLEPEA
jgi:enamine deaminase RidA (YjgF/YER057c/UK114 family)